tara:strand:- start:1466 stop:1885 length:420 start_codon:yes stop_codon:yes gene_type:complete
MGFRKTVDQKIGQVGTSFDRDTLNAELDLLHERLNLTVNRGDTFLSRVVVQGNYTIPGDASYIGVNTEIIAATLALPDGDDAIKDRVYIIKDESNSAATRNITIITGDATLIDKASTKTISTNMGVTSLFFTGTEWLTL